MNAEKKVIKHKFSVLELTETLGNISSACRQKGRRLGDADPLPKML